MLILRMGERDSDDAERGQGVVPGTMLMPGASGLGHAAAPPCVPWQCFPPYPMPFGPTAFEECLCDGGDTRIPVGLGHDGNLRGLDPTDAAAVYDCKHCRYIAVSNRCCFFAPRFVALRTDLAPSGYLTVVNPVAAQSTLAQALIEERRIPRIYSQIDVPHELDGRLKPSGIEALMGLVQIDQLVEPVVATARVQGMEIVGVCKKEPPCGPLVLCKWCGAKAARIGDVVTFHLKFTNTGGQPMTNVVVSDSLAARLEYVPGSNRSDRDAVFTTRENEDGSLVLRWELGGALPPGQSGMVRFDAKVR
jgi:uncharacterized repeat protein (TIGR01451 family)